MVGVPVRQVPGATADVAGEGDPADHRQTGLQTPHHRVRTLDPRPSSVGLARAFILFLCLRNTSVRVAVWLQRLSAVTFTKGFAIKAN